MATTIQFKRSTAARLTELNLVFADGEPVVEYDTKKMKVGDGVTHWNDLPYFGSNDDIIFISTFSQLPFVGKTNCLYSVMDEKTLYQWNSSESKYEPLNMGGGSFNPNEIKLINGGNANG